MKKFNITFCLLLTILLLSGCSLFGGDDQEVDNTEAISNDEIRTVTIVNNTNQIINEIIIYVNEGTEIKECRQKNPDDKSISIEIPKEYKKYKKFSVLLEDRYGTQYLIEKTNVAKKGNTEIVFDSDTEVDESSSLFTDLDKLFNGN